MTIGLGLGLTFSRSRTFSPLSLFAGGEVGVWYDPSDLTTLFQDTAGTTPVTTPGQSVGLMLDKSGNDHHATQPTAAARPTYQTDGTLHWLDFDGIDDFMVTPTITPGIDKVQVFAGVRKLSDAVAIVAETSAISTVSNGAFYVVAGVDLLADYSTLSRGTSSGRGSIGKIVGPKAPDSAALTVANDISADIASIRRNGVAGSTGIGAQGTGNYLAYPMYIGARAGTSIPFNGHIYSLIARFGANLDAPVIGEMETYVASKTGVTL